MTKVASVKFKEVTLDIDKRLEFKIEDSTSDKVYSYFIPEGLDVSVGDLCLVSIRNSPRLSVVRIESITDDIVSSNYSYLMSKLDFSAIKTKSEIIRQRELLEKKIDAAYKKASKIKILEEMGKTDPEIQKLVDEYKELN